MAMNVFAPIARAMAALRVNRADPQRRGFGLFRGNAGPVVTHDNAQQVAAVWACMDVIARSRTSLGSDRSGAVDGSVIALITFCPVDFADPCSPVNDRIG